MAGSTFAQLYDAYITQFKDDLPFWASVAEACGGPILELGCGTGRVLLELVKAGFIVEGIDNNPDMVDIAQSKLLPDFESAVNLHLDDIRTFSVPARFPLIIVPCNTFAYFNEEECEQLLNRSHAHLTPGGHLIIDLPNPEFTIATDSFGLIERETELESTFISSKSNYPVQVSTRRESPLEDTVLDISWYFDELHPDGSVQRFEHQLRYHLRSAQSSRRMLTEAGFSQTIVFGDYDSSTYTPESPRLIIKGQKEKQVSV